MTRTIIDQAAGRLHVERARHEPTVYEVRQRADTLRMIAAETHARELVEALKSAVAGAPHWRFEAQELLRRIAAGQLKEPKP